MNYLALVPVVTILLSNLANAAEFPIALTDDRPAKVTLETKPERIVTLASFAADMAVALDIKPIAVTTYNSARAAYLGEALQSAVDLGDLTAPNLESMAQLDADLTVGMLRYNGPFEKEITAISPFLAYSTGNIEASYKVVRELGKAYGYPAEAEKMNTDYAALLQNIQAKIPAEGGPSFLLVWNFFDTMYAFQSLAMAAEIPTALGGENLAGIGTGSPEDAYIVIEPEQLLVMDPDYLLVFSSHGNGVKAHPMFAQLNAVKNGRAFSIGSQYSKPTGPIARDLITREIAHLFYPDAFSAPAMPEAARATTLSFIE